MKRKLRVKRLRVEGLRRLALGLVLLSTLNFQLSTSLAIEEMAFDAQGNQLPLKARPQQPAGAPLPTPYPPNLRPEVKLDGTNLLQRIADAAAAGGGGGGLTLPSAAARGIEKEVYITVRTDGVGGDGTEINPYNAGGATQAIARVNFDAVLGASGSIGDYTHVHLGPGTFYTNQIKFREGMIIEGAGKYLTTVMFPDGTAQTAAVWKVFGSDAAPYFNYVSLRNLTIDTNKANQAVYTSNINNGVLYALRVLANNADIINVRSLGVWNGDGVGDNGNEGFPVAVKHDDTVVPTDKITFDGCDVIDPYGYHTAIAAFSDSTTPGAADFRVEIKNCYVQNHTGGSCFGVGHNAPNSSIHHNRAYSVATGTTIDSGSHSGLRFYSNSFTKLKGRGVYLGGLPTGGVGPYSNITINDNYFQFDSDANGSAVSHSGIGANTGFQFDRNTVIQEAAGYPALLLTPTAAGSVRDNTITETTKTDFSTHAALQVSDNTNGATGALYALRSGSSLSGSQAVQSVFDPDVATFYGHAVSNGGTVSTTTTSALNKLVAGFKADGTWTKITSFYPLCGDYAASVTKLKHPAGASPFLINSGFTSGDYVETGATGGYKPNGTTIKVLDTGYNPVAAGASESSFAMGAYVSGTEANGTSRVIMGNQADSGGTNRTILGWVSAGTAEYGVIASTSGGTTGATKRDGLLVVSCDGDRTMDYYDDGGLITSAVGSGTFVNSTFYLNAVRSSSGALGLSTRYLRAAFTATGLSAGDVASIYSRIQNFQTALGRQVGTPSYEPFDVNGSVIASGNINAAQNVIAGGNVQAGGTGSVTGHTMSAETTVAGDGSLLTNLDARKVSATARDVTGASTSITSSDYVIRHPTIPGGGATDTLAAGWGGAVVYIEDTSNTSGTNNITLATSAAETFTTGGTSKTISTNGQTVRVEWTGTKWHAVVENPL